MIVDNLFAWSVQICVLAAAGAGVALTLAHARARLIFWQGLLAIMLLLPAIEPWRAPEQRPAKEFSAGTGQVWVLNGPEQRRSLTWRNEYLFYIAGTGAALRLLWIGVGLARLRRHRKSAHELSAAPVASDARVRWYVSETVSSPMTFGWRRPSIFLPARFEELEPDLREAIACHELIHVRRNDWLFVLGEELVRAALWFHPAIWFVLSHIHLAREQSVDLEVVERTRDRDRYLDALVAAAAQKLSADLVPAPLFLKRRQLAMRVAALLKERKMSKARLVAGFTAASTAALAVACAAVWMFPLRSSAQVLAPDSPGVAVDAGGKLMHRTPIIYSGSASGTVLLEASLNAKGVVTDAHVLSGPEELRSTALRSVLDWHYAEGTGSTIQVAIKFGQSERAQPVPVVAQKETVNITSVAPASPASGVLKSIDVRGASAELREQVLRALPVHEGDTISVKDMPDVIGAARSVDEHFSGGLTWSASNSTPREAVLRLTLANPQLASLSALLDAQKAALQAGATREALAISAAAPDASAQNPPQRIRVGGNVQAANLIKKVTPPYPPEAKAARVQGVVSYTATIGKDGTIKTLELVTGDPMLEPAAREAVAQWQYRPTLLNGQPVEVITQIDVHFTLSQ